jgi:hypothetical protein
MEACQRYSVGIIVVVLCILCCYITPSHGVQTTLSRHRRRDRRDGHGAIMAVSLQATIDPRDVPDDSPQLGPYHAAVTPTMPKSPELPTGYLLKPSHWTNGVQTEQGSIERGEREAMVVPTQRKEASTAANLYNTARSLWMIASGIRVIEERLMEAAQPQQHLSEKGPMPSPVVPTSLGLEKAANNIQVSAKVLMSVETQFNADPATLPRQERWKEYIVKLMAKLADQERQLEAEREKIQVSDPKVQAALEKFVLRQKQLETDRELLIKEAQATDADIKRLDASIAEQ